MERDLAQTGLNLDLVEREFPRGHQTNYLNTGSAGRKPRSVLDTVSQGWSSLNDNPTLTTFLDPSIHDAARTAVANMHALPEKSVLLVQNPSQAMHLLMGSFLRKAGDELVTTTHEHGCVYTVARHLEETRGIVTRKFPVDLGVGSVDYCLGLLDLVTEKTKLVVVSEVSCASGWRPELGPLIEALSVLETPILIDGAHVSGHVVATPSRFPMWVGSGHKWLGGPNGTGFAYVAPNLVPMLEPVWLGDKYFKRLEADNDDITRFESTGTSDVVRWLGLTRAIQLYQELGAKQIMQRQNELVSYLRRRLDETLKPTFRTPLESDSDHQTAILTFHFDPERLRVQHLPNELWERYQICTRDDFVNAVPGAGLRVSCHYSVTESDLDALISALDELVEKA